MDMTTKSCREFVTVLASNEPAPGGGGAAALVAALGTALGNMVGSLTVGKKKYADVEAEIVGSRLNNGAASVFLGALGERHGGLQHALHRFWRKAPRFVIARRPEADVAISRHMPNNRKTIGEIAAAFPRLHPKGTSSRFALRAPRPLRGLAMTIQASAVVHQRPSTVEYSPTRRSLPARGTPHP